MIYLTADTHFNHNNILHLCNRPFKDIEDMNNTLVRNINNKINKNDDLYILGDFMFSRDIRDYRKMLKRLNGKIHIVLGNHDNKQFFTQLKNEKLVEEVRESLFIKDTNVKIFCSHFPYLEWAGFYHNTYHAFGHVHGNISVEVKNSLDVGVDSNFYSPVSINEFLRKCNQTKNSLDFEDEKYNEEFPNLPKEYLINLCMNNEEIKNLIKETLLKETNL